MSARVKGLLAVALCCLATLLWAQGGSQTIKEIIPVIQGWTRDPVLIQAILAQNAHKQTMDEIHARDAAWLNATTNDPFITSLMENAAAKTLRKFAASEPYFTELILMDQQGSIVAITNRTSDYWQGDEDKFLQTYPVGTDAVHKSKPEFDASVGGYVVQVSVPVADKGQNIGVLTVNISLKAIR